MTLDEGYYYITFCCDNLWKSKFMALEKPGKLREFFFLLYGHPDSVQLATLLNFGGHCSRFFYFLLHN